MLRAEHRLCGWDDRVIPGTTGVGQSLAVVGLRSLSLIEVGEFVIGRREDLGNPGDAAVQNRGEEKNATDRAVRTEQVVGVVLAEPESEVRVTVQTRGAFGEWILEGWPICDRVGDD